MMVTVSLISNWQDKGLTCHCCGTNRSVKYAVDTNGSINSYCNTCVLSTFFVSNFDELLKKEEM